MLRRLALTCALLAAAAAAFAEVPPAARAAVERRDFIEAERALIDRLSLAPEDAEARYLLARVLAWQGRHEHALAEFERLLANEPANSDYLLGEAQALVWKGEPERALPLLAKARRLAPQYEDVWRAQIAALVALGDAGRLRQARLIRAEARRRFPQSSWEFRGLDERAVE